MAFGSRRNGAFRVVMSVALMVCSAGVTWAAESVDTAADAATEVAGLTELERAEAQLATIEARLEEVVQSQAVLRKDLVAAESASFGAREQAELEDEAFQDLKRRIQALETELAGLRGQYQEKISGLPGMKERREAQHAAVDELQALNRERMTLGGERAKVLEKLSVLRAESEPGSVPESSAGDEVRTP